MYENPKEVVNNNTGEWNLVPFWIPSRPQWTNSLGELSFRLRKTDSNKSLSWRETNDKQVNIYKTCQVELKTIKEKKNRTNGNRK